MTTYTISTEAFDSSYDAATEGAAILAYVRDAGYETVAEAAEVLGQTEDEFVAGLTITAA